MAVEAFDDEILLLRILDLLERIFAYLDAPDPGKLGELRAEKARLDKYLVDTGRKP